jgi:hypothetical protein
MDRVIADFDPCLESTPSPLIVRIGDGPAITVPIACDVNRMAGDHRWKAFEGARRAKSYIGTAMVAAGAGVAAYGVQRDNGGAAIAGLVIAAAGAYMKAQAHADTRYCEVMPQRYYVVALKANGRDPIHLEVDGAPHSALKLVGLGEPSSATAQFRYVRLVSAAPAAPAWATSGRVLYASDWEPAAGVVKLPYILGGDDVRFPSEEALSEFQSQGFLQGMSLSELQDLYRAEGIAVEPDVSRVPGLHVLEGGKCLLPPMPGTTGFARLFGQQHPPYRPSSKLVRELASQLKPQVAAVRSGASPLAVTPVSAKPAPQ